MNQELKNDIVKYLNQVEALKSCEIEVKKSLGLYIRKVNQTSRGFLVLNNSMSNFKMLLQQNIDNGCSKPMIFFVEADMKISDIEQLDVALNKILRLDCENIEFEYVKEEIN